MRAVLDQLQRFIEQLENIQKNADVLSLTSDDQQIVSELLKQLRDAINNKENDLQIAQKALSTIQANCIGSETEPLMDLLNSLSHFLNNTIKSRSQLCRATIAFITDCKLISNTDHLKMESYNPQIITTLEYLLQTPTVLKTIAESTTENLYQIVNESPLFAKNDLLLSSRMTFNRLQPSFKALITLTEQLSPKRHATVDIDSVTLDPVVLARFQRMAKYGNLQASRSAPVLRSATTIPSPETSRSLPASPKDAPPSFAATPAFLRQFQSPSGMTSSSSTPPIVPPLPLADLPDLARLHLEKEHRKTKNCINKN